MRRWRWRRITSRRNNRTAIEPRAGGVDEEAVSLLMFVCVYVCVHVCVFTVSVHMCMHGLGGGALVQE